MLADVYLHVRAEVADGQFHVAPTLRAVIIEDTDSVRDEPGKEVFEPALGGVAVEVYEGVARVVVRGRGGVRKAAPEVLDVVEFEEIPHLFEIGRPLAPGVLPFEPVVLGDALPCVE